MKSPEPARHADIHGGSAVPAAPACALLQLGFRPFYLLCAAFAAVSILYWLGQFMGAWPGSRYLPAALWHAHEMVFGFATAAITGFLFTAVRNWTGLPTPTGAALAAFALLWTAARITLVSGPAPLAAILDTLFLPLVAASLFRLLRRAGNSRNYPLAAVLLGMGAANAVFHLAALGLVPVAPLTPLQLSLDGVLLVAMTIAGRIIPSFTAAAIPGLVAVVRPRRERIVFATSLLAFAASVLGLPGAVIALAAFAAAVAQLWRMSGWNSLTTRHSPILWILHLSYAWVPAGFVLLGLAGMGVVSPIASYHAFGIGVVAGLIIGMMTRTARGHTGRPLRVGAAETMAYVMVHLAAVLRLAPLLGLTRLYGECLLVSGLLFAAAFLIYLVVYLPFLLRPRLDGKPG